MGCLMVSAIRTSHLFPRLTVSLKRIELGLEKGNKAHASGSMNGRKGGSVIPGDPQGFSEDKFGPLTMGLLFSVPT